MPWNNGPIVVYHGTDSTSAQSIRSRGIDPSKFRQKTDFGLGFYVTTVLHQAEQWANQRCRRTAAANAEVLQFDVSRSTTEKLRHLSFVVEDMDYWDFVAYCRVGGINHGPLPRSSPYDLVYGPVSLWPQKLVIAACDQILFSNPAAISDFNDLARSIRPSGGKRFF